MEKKPFRIMQKFLSSVDQSNTQETMAGLLEVSERTLSSWCTTKFTTSKKHECIIEDIVAKFFTSDDIMLEFVDYLNDLGYDVSSYSLYKDKIPKSKFESLIRKFLYERLKKKSDTPTTKDTHTDVFLYKKPKQYFQQTLYASNDNGENEVIFDFDENNNYAKIKELGHILIEAVGGQGKSLFLAKLFESAAKSNDFEYVFLVDLPELAALTKKKTHPLADRSAYYLLSYLSTISNDFLRSVAQLTEDNKEGFPRTLLLLDGYNEVFSLSDFDSLQIIDEIAYISEKWPATIIMTSRPSTEKRNFLNDYHTCNISGTPKEKAEEITQENSNVPDEILRLAEIPLFYNAFAELKGKCSIKTKYDLLFHILLKQYKQSGKSFEAFISYFVFSPLVIKHMVDNNKNRLSIEEIKSFSKEFGKMNLEKFISIAAAECDVTCPVVDYDPNKIRTIFINQGPFEPISKETLKIHDELRDFLLVFGYTVMRKVFRDSLEEGQYDYVRDLDFKLNLKDNACNLLKESLGISSGEDLNKLDEYSVLNDCQLNPQSILFSYTLFMLSDNLTLGSSALAPFHEILSMFIARICRLVRQGNFENCLKDGNSLVTEEQKITFKLLDVMSKDIEFYRKSGKEIDGLKLIEICEKIKPEYSTIKHQKAKLHFSQYEKHVKSDTEFDLKSIGFSDYSELYEEGINLLEEVVKTDNFAFSNILLAVLHSTPPPFLYNDPKISVEIDYVKAFNLYCSLIFADKKFIIKRVTYAVRKVVGLLLNSYVVFNPDFEVYEEVNPKNCVVLGDRNILNLDRNTLKIAKHLMKLVDGVNATSLNFYRAVIALYYDQDRTAAKQFLDLESDRFLKPLFLLYEFGEETDLDALYNDVRKEINDPKLDSFEKVSFLYLYYDMKNFELSFDKSRKNFFDRFEEDLPETIKSVIHNN